MKKSTGRVLLYIELFFLLFYIKKDSHFIIPYYKTFVKFNSRYFYGPSSPARKVLKSASQKCLKTILEMHKNNSGTAQKQYWERLKNTGIKSL